MTNKVEKFKQITEGMNNLYAKKNSDKYLICVNNINNDIKFNSNISTRWRKTYKEFFNN